MITLRLGQGDLGRCRFALSPLLETTGAVRALLAGGHHAVHLPWLRGARPLAAPAKAVLAAVISARGYTPDFLTPPPAHPSTSIEAELAAVAETPAELTVQELTRALGRRRLPPAIRDLLADPAGLPARLADLLAHAWSQLVEPYWDQLRGILDTDIAYRARRIGHHGLDALLADLHPHVAWNGAELAVTKPVRLRRDLRGEGLLLVPSAFTWPDVQVVLNAPWQPTLVYPARGVGTLRKRPATASPALAGLLGATRARLLAELRVPATTTELAHRHRLAPATVSRHLTVLRDAGLLTGRRDGRWVRYELTPLGQALVRSDGRER